MKNMKGRREVPTTVVTEKKEIKSVEREGDKDKELSTTTSSLTPVPTTAP